MQYWMFWAMGRLGYSTGLASLRARGHTPLTDIRWRSTHAAALLHQLPVVLEDGPTLFSLSGIEDPPPGTPQMAVDIPPTAIRTIQLGLMDASSFFLLLGTALFARL